MGTDRARRRHEIKRDGFMFYQRTFLVTGGSSYDLGLVVDKTQPTTAKALRRLYTKIQQPDLSRAFCPSGASATQSRYGTGMSAPPEGIEPRVRLPPRRAIRHKPNLA
jgi:hypothetical protein